MFKLLSISLSVGLWISQVCMAAASDSPINKSPNIYPNPATQYDERSNVFFIQLNPQDGVFIKDIILDFARESRIKDNNINVQFDFHDTLAWSVGSSPKVLAELAVNSRFTDPLGYEFFKVHIKRVLAPLVLNDFEGLKEELKERARSYYDKFFNIESFKEYNDLDPEIKEFFGRTLIPVAFSKHRFQKGDEDLYTPRDASLKNTLIELQNRGVRLGVLTSGNLHHEGPKKEMIKNAFGLDLVFTYTNHKGNVENKSELLIGLAKKEKYFSLLKGKKLLVLIDDKRFESTMLPLPKDISAKTIVLYIYWPAPEQQNLSRNVDRAMLERAFTPLTMYELQYGLLRKMVPTGENEGTAEDAEDKGKEEDVSQNKGKEEERPSEDKSLEFNDLNPADQQLVKMALDSGEIDLESFSPSAMRYLLHTHLIVDGHIVTDQIF